MKLKKIFIYTGLAAVMLYTGDKLDLNRQVSGAYNSAKETTIDLLTTDAGEAADNFIEELEEEQDLSGYSDKLYKAAGEATRGMNNQQKEELIIRLSEGLDSSQKWKLFGRFGTQVYDNTSETFEEKVKDIYNRIKEKLF